jgi:mitogen-activated protein kinase organizer 1
MKCCHWICECTLLALLCKRSSADQLSRSSRAPDNATFASGGGDKAVLLWDVASGTVIRRLQAHFGKINAVKFGGSGGAGKDAGASVLVSGSFDSKVMIWDMRLVVIVGRL